MFLAAVYPISERSAVNLGGKVRCCCVGMMGEFV
jgi:hypothetical protein